MTENIENMKRLRGFARMLEKNVCLKNLEMCLGMEIKSQVRNTS